MFAVEAHSGQRRKNSAMPYIIHPMEACSIAATLTDDTDVLIAVLLHDTVEDTDTTLDDIRREFGDRVAGFVEGETEEKYNEIPREQSWKLRKEISLSHLSTAQREVKIMWLADKLSNLRSFCRLYAAEGDAMWDHFNCKDKSLQEWYYRTVLDSLSEFSGCEAYDESLSRVNTIFAEE